MKCLQYRNSLRIFFCFCLKVLSTFNFLSLSWSTSILVHISSSLTIVLTLHTMCAHCACSKQHSLKSNRERKRENNTTVNPDCKNRKTVNQNCKSSLNLSKLVRHKFKVSFDFWFLIFEFKVLKFWERERQKETSRFVRLLNYFFEMLALV